MNAITALCPLPLCVQNPEEVINSHDLGNNEQMLTF